jgi:hypothetical protein
MFLAQNDELCALNESLQIWRLQSGTGLRKQSAMKCRI